MRKIYAILFLLITMTACTAETEIETSSQKQDEKKAEENSDNGVIQEVLSASLVEVEKVNEDKEFIYEVKNNTGQDIEIPFDKDGGHVYVVRDESGKELSRQDGYGTIQSDQVVSPGEAITIKIGLGGYKKGTYELEVWMESGLENSFNQTIVFTIE